MGDQRTDVRLATVARDLAVPLLMATALAACGGGVTAERFAERGDAPEQARTLVETQEIALDLEKLRPDFRPGGGLQPPAPLDLSVSDRSGRTVVDGVMLPMGRRVQLKATGGYDDDTSAFVTVLSLKLRF